MVFLLHPAVHVKQTSLVSDGFYICGVIDMIQFLYIEYTINLWWTESSDRALISNRNPNKDTSVTISKIYKELKNLDIKIQCNPILNRVWIYTENFQRKKTQMTEDIYGIVQHP